MKTDPLRVLVVDDDEADFILVQEALSQTRGNSFLVEHITSFEQARDALLEDRYDIYLVDYYLGVESGLDLLREARKAHIDSPLIVLTGADNSELDDVVMENGASDFLPKDELSSRLLERTIRHALERKKVERRLQTLIKQDPLTGLANRSLFEEDMKRSLARAKRNHCLLAVMFLDLNRFKEVNDLFGHHMGDLLLNRVAERIQAMIREEDVLARIGGDEFTLLLDSLKRPEDAAMVAEKIIDGLAKPVPTEEASLMVSASVGIALFPSGGETPTQLMQNADIALYEEKKNGGGNYQFFTRNLQTQLKRNAQIEKGLRRALEAGEFELHFQPQWRLKEQSIVGAEALVRWRQPDGSLLLPGEFIPVAERTGLIISMGEWIFELACRQLQQWSNQGLERLSIAINVSPRQLKSPQLITNIQSIVKRTGVDPRRIEIELTEALFADTDPETKDVLVHLKAMGMAIAIDDFGTGYSSMRYLKHFPLNALKIDRSFVSGGDTSELAEPVLARSVIALAKAMGLEVIAEGIETKEQLAYLKKKRCERGQGFYLATPMDASEFTALIQRQPGPNASAPDQEKNNNPELGAGH